MSNMSKIGSLIFNNFVKIENPKSCSPWEKCPSGYTEGKDGMCWRGWTESCGQNCAYDICVGNGGTWVPADYRVSAYLCRAKSSQYSSFPLTLYSGNGYSGEKECYPEEGKYRCNLPNVGSLKLSNNYLAVLFTGDNNTGNFISTKISASAGSLIDAKSVLLLSDKENNLSISLSSQPFKQTGPNFWLSRGLYPRLTHSTIGSYDIPKTENPYYSKNPNDGIMFYSEENYIGKSFYLGTKSSTTGHAIMGFAPKSFMIFKADKIYFYKNEQLQGQETSMEVIAYPDLEETFNNKTNIVNSSSVSIPEGIIAMLYTEKNFTGKKLILSAGGYNLPNGWNDHVKSAHFFTLEGLKKYQEKSFDKERIKFFQENSTLKETINITKGWENAEYNIVARNRLAGGTCFKNIKAVDMGIQITSPEEFVLDFYGGLFTKKEAENYAKSLNIPYFGYVVNQGNDVDMDNMGDTRKLHYFGGFKLNSNDKKMKTLGTIFGTHLHVYRYDYVQDDNTDICVQFIKQANKMNEYARIMNEAGTGDQLYSQQSRINNIRTNLNL